MHVAASCSYNGKVVAKLPFQPFSFLAKVTRRGIEDTEDISLCAWVCMHLHVFSDLHTCCLAFVVLPSCVTEHPSSVIRWDKCLGTNDRLAAFQLYSVKLTTPCSGSVWLVRWRLS
jgi:hypothetical protein